MPAVRDTRGVSVLVNMYGSILDPARSRKYFFAKEKTANKILKVPIFNFEEKVREPEVICRLTIHMCVH